MGIKQLNKLIRYHSPLKTINISELNGKTIVIDTMIYIYKYMANDSLLENIYMMCVLMRHHKIKPIFIFDGDKPEEKRDELNRRREQRKEAWLKYDKLIEDSNNNELNSVKVKKELMKLKRQCIKIKSHHIEEIKKLITLLGMNYIVAEGEADKLCAELVINKEADACMSDDMDLFVYGCPYVLRLFNISRKTTILYDLNSILSYLNMSFYDFKIMCTLCGTDYNIEYNKHNIFKIYSKYNYYIKNVDTDKITFLDWIVGENKNYDKKCICNTINMFNVKKNNNYKMITNKFVDKINLYKLLEKEFFLNPIEVY